ncbi:RES family NAD+ phosphorylase [Mesorhizobium sp. BAC0120]|nr:RES family NAD+ phosphorylase [Mesorhizobium sp. BAC0120]MDW6021552.1 RES family NAD+ phosphorylase [Mesorhizobium sp. BAC0120]
MIRPEAVPVSPIDWRGAVRIIRSIYPPIDLFEDIADPADWPLLLSGEQKTNPRVMETIGNLDLVMPERRVGGPGASWLMAPFTHVSPDRPSRFSNGTFGVLYVGDRFEVALFETIHHHSRFMRMTQEPAGWTSQFREIVMHVAGRLHDLRANSAQPSVPDEWNAARSAVLDSNDYHAGQALGAALRSVGSDGIVYPSVRCEGGECAGLFYPDLAASPMQGRHLEYHWDGERVDLYRDAATRQVVRIL